MAVIFQLRSMELEREVWDSEKYQNLQVMWKNKSAQTFGQMHYRDDRRCRKHDFMEAKSIENL